MLADFDILDFSTRPWKVRRSNGR